MPEHVAVFPFMQEEMTEETEIALQFTDIYEAYYKRIFNYVSYRVSSTHTAEDLTSIVFEKILNKLSTYSNQKAPFEVWMFAIARNVVNDHHRKQKKRQWFSLEVMKEFVSSRKDPEKLFLSEERSDKLITALNKLNERERNLVALKFGACLRNTEVAEITGLSESNIGVILYRAMKKLKIELGSVEHL
jgi:RNA polymerase sigma-70 factor (ECF subfamily)